MMAIGNAAALAAAFFQQQLFDSDSEDEDFVWEKVTVFVDEFLQFGDLTFRRHFRLSRTQFDMLCEELCDHLYSSGQISRRGRDFRHKILIVLWILGTPDSFRSVALRFGVHPGEVHRYYKMVVAALSDIGGRYIIWPDAAERTRIKNTLHRISGFPGVVGMIDGKHIYITKPVEEPAAYRNRHHSYSILVQAVCDDHLRILDLYAGEAGSLHDARVFRRSPLCRKILFQPELFSDGEHIIGDSAYLLTDRLLSPFVNNGHLTVQQRNYNHALSQIRVRIEHAFGKYTMLWRRNKFLFVKKMSYAVDHVCATFVLHNFRIATGDVYNLENVVDEPNDVAEDFIDAAEDNEQVIDPYIHDVHDIDVEGAARLRMAQARGVQKRWDMCNGFYEA